MSKAKTAATTAAATMPTPPPPAFEPSENDIVADILAAVQQIWPELEPDKLRQAEEQIRERWGGDRPYIGRRAGHGSSARNEAIVREHQRGERLPYLARRYKLSERRILQIISQAHRPA
jgi:Mor family transcriptional regulator